MATSLALPRRMQAADRSHTRSHNTTYFICHISVFTKRPRIQLLFLAAMSRPVFLLSLSATLLCVWRNQLVISRSFNTKCHHLLSSTGPQSPSCTSNLYQYVDWIACSFEFKPKVIMVRNKILDNPRT